MSRYRKTRSRRPSRSARHCRPRIEKLEDRRLLAVLFADSFKQSEWNGSWVEDSQNDWFRSSQRAADGARSAEVDGSASNATLSPANPIDLTTYDSAELTFSAGQTTGTFVLPIQGDQTPEDHESLTLNLTLDSGTATLVDAVAVGTILNDDTSITVSDATALEAGSTWEFADTIALGGGISGWPWGAAKGTNGDLYFAFSQINGGGGEDAGMEKIDGVTGEIAHDFVPIGTAGLFNAKEIEVHDDDARERVVLVFACFATMGAIT